MDITKKYPYNGADFSSVVEVAHRISDEQQLPLFIHRRGEGYSIEQARAPLGKPNIIITPRPKP